MFIKILTNVEEEQIHKCLNEKFDIYRELFKSGKIDDMTYVNLMLTSLNVSACIANRRDRKLIRALLDDVIKTTKKRLNAVCEKES